MITKISNVKIFEDDTLNAWYVHSNIPYPDPKDPKNLKYFNEQSTIEGKFLKLDVDKAKKLLETYAAWLFTIRTSFNLSYLCNNVRLYDLINDSLHYNFNVFKINKNIINSN